MEQGVPEENNFLLTHLFVLYFILREMTHDEPASETQHQYDAARQNRISRRELYEKGSNMLRNPRHDEQGTPYAIDDGGKSG